VGKPLVFGRKWIIKRRKNNLTQIRFINPKTFSPIIVNQRKKIRGREGSRNLSKIKKNFLLLLLRGKMWS